MPGYLSEAFLSFQGEGLAVGRRQLFLRFAGCPLRCRYCDTPESLVRTDNFVVRPSGTELRRPNPVDVADVAWAVDTLLPAGEPIDGVALTGGEPLAQVEFLGEVLRSGVLPRPRLLETAGTLARNLERIVDLVDLVSMDIKLPSNSGEAEYWEEHHKFLGIAGGKAFVKILVDENTAVAEVEHAVRLVRQAGAGRSVFLQPITGSEGEVRVSPAHLEKYFHVARAWIDDVRVVPQTHKMLRIL